MDLIIKEFREQIKWLYTLITDPTGSRYLAEKDSETRLREFQEQIARTADFLAFVDNPERKYSAVHIAGTSGKGSVTTMVAAILTECGLKTGYHISPYLQVSNEKLVIDGDMITPSEFVALVKTFRETYQAWTTSGCSYTQLLYTEAWIALTYLWLAQRKVDWAVIETSLGGRFDPTNVLPSKLAIITNVDFDHVNSLGPDLLDIAYHKAGIIKENGVVVTSATNKTVLPVIQEEAARKNARLYCIERDFNFTIQDISTNGINISVQTPFRRYQNIRVAMQGTFQLTNAALAITATDILAEVYDIPLSEESLRSTLAHLTFPGRMEIIQADPLVILDGAHNLHKMQALVDSLRTFYPDKRITALVGMLMTKDASALIGSLAPVVSRFVVAKPHVFGKPSFEPAELAKIIQTTSPAIETIVTDDVKGSIDLVLPLLDDDELLLVTGSLYLVGEARDYWLPRDQLLRDIEQKQQVICPEIGV